MADPILTRAEALQIALVGFAELRDEVREMAHAASGDENRPVREALMGALFRMDAWRDSLPGRFAADPAAGQVQVGHRLPQRPPNRGRHTREINRWAS